MWTMDISTEMCHPQERSWRRGRNKQTDSFQSVYIHIVRIWLVFLMTTCRLGFCLVSHSTSLPHVGCTLAVAQSCSDLLHCGSGCCPTHNFSFFFKRELLCFRHFGAAEFWSWKTTSQKKMHQLWRPVTDWLTKICKQYYFVMRKPCKAEVKFQKRRFNMSSVTKDILHASCILFSDSSSHFLISVSVIGLMRFPESRSIWAIF